MGVRLGGGRRQQAILKLMADGKARTSRTIADRIGLQSATTATTVAVLRDRHWVCDTGERGENGAHMWAITKDGRAVIADSLRVGGTPPG